MRRARPAFSCLGVLAGVARFSLMAKRKGNVSNLRPASTKDEARERGRNGGIASGKARAARKTFAETLKAMLSCAIPKSSPYYKKLKSQMRELGLDWEPTVQDIPILGILMRAAKNPLAYCAIRDTIGERPVEQTEDLTPPPPITLGIMPVVPPVSVD